MSSYVNFYVKNGKNQTTTYLFGFSRSNKVYQIFHRELYNHADENNFCKELTMQECDDLIKAASLEKAQLIELIDSCRQSMQDLASWNNTIEDKMEYYSSFESSIKEAQQDIEEYNYTIHFYDTLKEMMNWNPDHAVVLAGIECYASRDEADEDQ